MSRITREHTSRATVNYAVNRASGKIVTFAGYWKPNQPCRWAVWRPIPGIPELHRIGESERDYQLRQIATFGLPEQRNEAMGLLGALQFHEIDSLTYQAASERATAILGDI